MCLVPKPFSAVDSRLYTDAALVCNLTVSVVHPRLSLIFTKSSSSSSSSDGAYLNSGNIE